jgi:rhodanese-related sulfurtransferase
MLTPDVFATLLERGTWVVDARDRVSFGCAHIPGSLNIELSEAFATHVGSVVPFGAPLVLVLPDPVPPAAEEVMTQLVRIGYERVSGCLSGGTECWRTDGRVVRAYRTVDVAQLATKLGAVHVLDVRQPRECEGGRIPGSINIFVGDLPGRLAEVPRDREVWTICASGRRAALAASLLDRAGVPVTGVTSGGVPDWAANHM